MNLDLKNIDSESIKRVGKRVGQILVQNRLTVSSLVVLIIGVAVLVQINSLISPEIDEDYLEKEALTQEEIEFEQTAIDQLNQLNDSRIEIEAQFVDRDNPFANPGQ